MSKLPRTLSKTRAAPVPKTVLLELADLAHVPAAEREFFCETICKNVDRANERIKLTTGLEKKNAKIFWQSAITLYETIDKLGKRELSFLEKVLYHKEAFIFNRVSTSGVSGLRETSYQLALLFSFLADKPHPPFPDQPAASRKKGKSPGGRRPGAVRKPIFQDFVADLRITTKAANGHLTLNKHTGGGTLIAALQLLSPHLPSGFIPVALAATTLQNLIDQVSKAEKSAAQLA